MRIPLTERIWTHAFPLSLLGGFLLISSTVLFCLSHGRCPNSIGNIRFRSRWGLQMIRFFIFSFLALLAFLVFFPAFFAYDIWHAIFARSAALAVLYLFAFLFFSRRFFVFRLLQISVERGLKLHRWAGYLVMLFIFSHSFFLVKRRGLFFPWSVSQVMAISGVSLIFLGDAFIFFYYWINPSYTIFRLSHYLMILGVVFCLPHLFLDDHNWRVINPLTAILMGVLALYVLDKSMDFVAYRKTIRLRYRELCDDLFCWGTLEGVGTVQPGHWISLTIPGFDFTSNPFTIIPVPGVWGVGEILFKIHPGKSCLTRKLATEDPALFVSGPYGRPLRFNGLAETRVLIFVTGSGISVCLALLQALGQSAWDPPVQVIWSARSAELLESGQLRLHMVASALSSYKEALHYTGPDPEDHLESFILGRFEPGQYFRRSSESPLHNRVYSIGNASLLKSLKEATKHLPGYSISLISETFSFM